jgi:peptide/nickel transport system substrate-binding protein
MRPVPAIRRGISEFPEELTMPRIVKGFALVVGALAALVLTDAAQAQKKTLTVALNQDPDILDPTLARTYVGRIIFSQMCEKLYEIDEGLRIHRSSPPRCPRSPTAADGHDQAPLGRQVQRRHADGRRVRAVLARPAPHAEGLEPRQRAGAVEAVEVVDPLTVRLS